MLPARVYIGPINMYTESHLSTRRNCQVCFFFLYKKSSFINYYKYDIFYFVHLKKCTEFLFSLFCTNRWI